MSDCTRAWNSRVLANAATEVICQRLPKVNDNFLA